MSDWLHNLPIVWMALLVFGLTAAIYVVIAALSAGDAGTQRWLFE